MFKTMTLSTPSLLFLCAAGVFACDSSGKKIHFDGSPDVRLDAGTDVASDAAGDLAVDTGAGDAAAPTPDTAAPMMDTGAPDLAPAAPTCNFTQHPLRRLPAEIVLVVDRSASMRTLIPGTTVTRWSEITNAVEEVVNNTRGSLTWGLKYFPTADACAVSPGLDVSLGNDLHASIRSTQPNAGRPGSPLPQAVSGAAAALSSRKNAASRFLVVATDGEPSCPAGPLGAMASVEAVTQAAAAGVRTFVLGVTAPDAEDQATLDRLAVAGGEPNAGTPRYYTAGSKGKFLAALTNITSSITMCVFNLDTAPPSPADNALYIDGRKIPMDTTQSNGWNWGGTNTQVQIYGPACEALKTSTPTKLEMVFGCKGAPAP